MPEPHQPRDENPRRKIAPHRLGKHTVLEESRSSAGRHDGHSHAALSVNTGLAGRLCLSDKAPRSRSAGDGTRMWAAGNRQSDSSRWNLWPFSASSASLRWTDLLLPKKLEGFTPETQRAQRKTQEATSHRLRITSHALLATSHSPLATLFTLPRRNSRHRERPLRNAYGERERRSSACRWGRCVALR
jgi:hypothetical protein